jgi:hypothetical protein
MALTSVSTLTTLHGREQSPIASGTYGGTPATMIARDGKRTALTRGDPMNNRAILATARIQSADFGISFRIFIPRPSCPTGISIISNGTIGICCRGDPKIYIEPGNDNSRNGVIA